MIMDNDSELLPVVDAEGRVMGSIRRGEAHDGCKVLHPVVHLHLMNSAGELYLQHRPAWKKVQPDKWDTACGGHIAYGESVEDALKREVSEELGIVDYRPETVCRYVFESRIERELVYLYRTVYDGEINPSADELSGGRFFTMAELGDSLGKGMITPNCEMELVDYLLICSNSSFACET